MARGGGRAIATRRGKGMAGTPKKETTLGDLLSLMERNTRTLEDNTDELKSITKRMTRLEARLQDVEEKVAAYEKQSELAKQEVTASLTAMREMMEEENRRLLRRDNFLIYGLPENGQQQFNELMQILAPENQSQLTCERIGNSMNPVKPRPILVRTGNSNIKLSIFRNLKKLKDVETFRLVNIQHDLTIQQRRERQVKNAQNKPNFQQQVQRPKFNECGVRQRSPTPSDEVDDSENKRPRQIIQNSTNGTTTVNTIPIDVVQNMTSIMEENAIWKEGANGG